MQDRERARKRAKELVSKMTTEEKAEQLKYAASAVERLGIPAYNWWNEALHGVARAGVATVFPQAIGLAATFDKALMEKIGDCIAIEGRAKYNAYRGQDDRDIYKGLTFWAPNVNIFRDPRWGRGHETYGEDPYLTGEMGEAFVEGMQGDGEYLKAAACAKHFAVHSGPESLRHKFNAEVSKKDLRETYLPAFEKLVKKAKVEAVMGAYNRTNGEPCCASPALQEILRGEWGFEGHFVSDCWALRDFHTQHFVTDTAEESAALAIKNGCDVNCGNTYLHLLKALDQGLITEEDLTRAAENLFTTRFLLGMFDETEYDVIGLDEVESPAHLALTRRAAAESVVLLKNDGILPLDKTKLKNIAVVGPNANSRSALIGNYHGTASRYVTVLEGIQDYLGEDVRVYYSEGAHLYKDKVENLSAMPDRLSEAKALADYCDLTIVCLGLDETLEGEEGDTGNSDASGDKIDLSYPESQRKLLEAVVSTGKPVVLVSMTGSAMDLRYADANCNAILQAWYPGALGGRAVADILFGEISPAGKLPVTFYESAEDLPSFEDYAMKGRTYRYLEKKPLYPFGYGLTYGKMEIVEAFLGGSREVMDEVKREFHREDVGVVLGGNPRTVRVTVKNPCDRELSEVVQVYCKATDSPHATPNPRLCGFLRVILSAGERAGFEIPIDEDAFTVVDDEGQKISGGDNYTFYVGFGQPDARTEELAGQKSWKLTVQNPGR